MYSTHYEGISAVAVTFLRTLKNKIYKYMTSKLKNVYTDKLDDIVNEYSNTYLSTIKIKPIEAKSSIYIDSGIKNNEKDPKFMVGDHERITKYKTIFVKGYAPSWSEEDFVIKRINNTVPWTYVIEDFNDEEIVGTYYEKKLQKTNQTKSGAEKGTKINYKCDELFVKWKFYDNSFKSWIDKKKCCNIK